jgi:hypothetical protein
MAKKRVRVPGTDPTRQRAKGDDPLARDEESQRLSFSKKGFAVAFVCS